MSSEKTEAPSTSEHLPAAILPKQPTQQLAAPFVELQGEVSPIEVDKAAVIFHEYQRFQQLCLTPDDWVGIQGKHYPKKSALRKWALACNVSTEIVHEQRVPAAGLDEAGNFYWKITARAYLRNGRTTVGTAIAAKDERKSWGSRIEHDCYSLACTRAVNRAVSDLIAGGAVSYEELLTEPVETASNTTAEGTADASPSWHVPITRDTANHEGIRQEPVFFKLASVGICNIDEQHSEMCFIPDRSVKSDAPPITSFLRSRILDVMKQKHAGDFDYSIEGNNDGTLRAVLVRTSIDPARMRELMDSVGWSFAKSSESLS